MLLWKLILLVYTWYTITNYTRRQAKKKYADTRRRIRHNSDRKVPGSNGYLPTIYCGILFFEITL
jgi:hypothetical protein